MRCYRYGEKCGNSLPNKSKFKMTKFTFCVVNMLILYTIHIVCYIKKTKAKKKAKQKQKKSKTKAKKKAKQKQNH